MTGNFPQSSKYTLVLGHKSGKGAKPWEFTELKISSRYLYAVDGGLLGSLDKKLCSFSHSVYYVSWISAYGTCNTHL